MNTNKKKIALICFDNPFLKPSEGGKRGIMTRIKSLLNIKNIDLDIYLHNKIHEGYADNLSILAENNVSWKQYQINSILSSAFSIYPISVKKRFVNKCLNDLSSKKYDIAIYEGEQVSAYRFENKVNADFHIIYMHDIESLYRYELSKAQRNLLLKTANIVESMKFRLLEKRVDSNFDQIWFVSCDESELFKSKLSDKNKCVYIPMPCLDISDKIAINSNNEMVYVGDLTLNNNLISLKWFIENVFKGVQHEIDDITLTVIGRINDNERKSIDFKGVNILGYVDNISHYYDNAACIICPVLFGAGVKVKIIDALGKGQIVVTTRKGIEGTKLENGVHLIASDDKKELINNCISIIKNRNDYIYLAKNGLEYIKNNHTIYNQTGVIIQNINKLNIQRSI